MATKKDRFLVWITLFIFLFISVLVVKMQPEEIQHIDIRGFPSMGSSKAKVQIVVFEDLKCVWCSHFTCEVFPEIKKNYIDTGKASYTLVTLAFLKGSKPAANAAFAVLDQDPKLFFPFVEAIYTEQPPEDEDWTTEEKLLACAKKVPGIDTKKMVYSMQKGSYNALIAENFAFAKELMKDKFGTPTVYINGKRIEELDYEAIREHIEEALHAS